MTNSQQKIILDAIEDAKGENVACISIEEAASIFDQVIIVTGTSKRHMSFLIDKIARSVKQATGKKVTFEGEGSESWHLIDAGNILVHVFSNEGREYYEIEKMYEAREKILSLS